MPDKYNKANLVDSARKASEKLARSVLWGETFGFTDAFGSVIGIKYDRKQMLWKKITIQFLDSMKTMFSIIIKNASITEKHLMLDLNSMREPSKDGIIDDTVSIRRK